MSEAENLVDNLPAEYIELGEALKENSSASESTAWAPQIQDDDSVLLIKSYQGRDPEFTAHANYDEAIAQAQVNPDADDNAVAGGGE